MKILISRLILRHIVSLFLVLSHASLVHAQNILTIRPEEDVSPLVNPGKGWISYDDPAKKSAEELSLTSVGYTRFAWSEIQPDGAGRFNWSKVDAFIDSWAGRGKKVAFGVMAANSHFGGDGYVTPKWVFDAGVPERVFKINGQSDVMTGSPGVKREPLDYSNPVFMKFLEQFVAAMAARYDGDPRIEFIDIRSFGNWGESFNRAHLLLHLKYFKKTRLAQSSQNAAWSEWIASHGVAVRRDGIGGSHGEELRPARGLTPAIMEFWGDVPYLEQRGWWDDGRLIPDTIEIGTATYSQFPPAPHNVLVKYQKLIEEMTNRMGFHFILKQVDYPGSVSQTMPMPIKFTWENDGVSKIFAPCVTALALIDDDGGIAYISTISGSVPGNWIPGQIVTENGYANLIGIQPGAYKIAVGLLANKADKMPSYKIGVKLPNIGDWYVLGKVTVTR